MSSSVCLSDTHLDEFIERYVLDVFSSEAMRRDFPCKQSVTSSWSFEANGGRSRGTTHAVLTVKAAKAPTNLRRVL